MTRPGGAPIKMVKACLCSRVARRDLQSFQRMDSTFGSAVIRRGMAFKLQWEINDGKVWGHFFVCPDCWRFMGPVRGLC